MRYSIRGLTGTASRPGCVRMRTKCCVTNATMPSARIGFQVRASQRRRRDMNPILETLHHQPTVFSWWHRHSCLCCSPTQAGMPVPPRPACFRCRALPPLLSSPDEPESTPAARGRMMIDPTNADQPVSEQPPAPETPATPQADQAAGSPKPPGPAIRKCRGLIFRGNRSGPQEIFNQGRHTRPPGMGNPFGFLCDIGIHC